MLARGLEHVHGAEAGAPVHAHEPHGSGFVGTRRRRRRQEAEAEESRGGTDRQAVGESVTHDEDPFPVMSARTYSRGPLLNLRIQAQATTDSTIHDAMAVVTTASAPHWPKKPKP